MADTRITNLTATATPAGTDELPTEQSAVSKKLTLAQIKTFANTAPAFAAGSTSAGSWPVHTPGANLLTTAEAGAIEVDANCFYGTTDAGNRGVIPVQHYIRCHSDQGAYGASATHVVFTTPTNGTLTLETGVYRFDGILQMTTMSATSGNSKLDILGAGGATTAVWMWEATALDNSSPLGPITAQTTFSVTKASPTSIATATAATTLQVTCRGTFEVTVAGTIIPTWTQVTSDSAVLKAGSYMMFQRIGATTMTSVGQWT